MARLAEYASTTETVSCIWYPDLRSQAYARKGCTVIVGVRLSGQERSTDCALRRLGLRGKSVSSMRECLGALVAVKRELSGVGPCRTQIITVCPCRAYAVLLCVSSAEKHMLFHTEPELSEQTYSNTPGQVKQCRCLHLRTAAQMADCSPSTYTAAGSDTLVFPEASVTENCRVCHLSS